MKQSSSNNAVLLISCPDKKGIVLVVTEFLYKNKANIVHLGQHVDSTDDHFFMRVEWELDDFVIPKEKVAEYFKTLIADQYNMEWQLFFTEKKPKMALFVTKMSHCLYDILSRVKSGEWDVEIPFIVSNHESLRPIADRFDIPYHYMPVTKANKKEVEAAQLKMLKDAEVDFIVLARYMQIISDDFITHYPNKIINIHHSFLPAFPGAKPYHSAFNRGVKIIGATSHYVTADLDAGPIIEQDVVRINHSNTIPDMIRKGKDLEKLVLSRGIWHHLKNRVVVHNNKTIVFS